MAFTKATYDYLDSGGLINWQLTAKTAAFTAVSGEGYLVDTTSAAITVTLPAAPSTGDEIIIVDYASNAGTNNITLGRNSLKIRGGTDDLVLSTNNQTARLLYSGATKGWLVTTEAGAGTAAAALPDLTVNYLVVAGGGGSGTNFSGGGGAGGLRTSFGSNSGGGASSESTPTLLTATTYTVTVGGGGGLNGQGGNSVFNTITSTGGGKGAGWQEPTSVGGSGGGQGVFNPGTYFLDGAAGTANQGYKGGGYYLNNSASAAGGGGGAGQAGQHGQNPTGGYGGDGIAVGILNSSNASTASVGEISGSTVYYAGGGGGSAMNPSGSVGGAGGTGGGGNGANDTGGGNSTNEAGTTNTGGGAGGGSRYSGQGKAGGSGVVIVRYPDAYTITVGSGITEASGSPFTESSDKVSVFTGGTGTITFAEA